MLDRHEAYESVNKCETLDELADVILSLADNDGQIQGRSRKFPAEIMAANCRNYRIRPKNSLTREFGIRQQAMMIEYYNY